MHKKPKFKDTMEEIRWFLDLPTCTFLEALAAHHAGHCIGRRARNKEWQPVINDVWKHEELADKVTWEDLLAKDWVIWEEEKENA